ncbi:hypothetical protein LUZ63_017047 [Rhynchospora breviuscula]|uniref:DDE Tnp4 domain-containing protein n=1 Tax=Rhynchospora breviuscula TaxID=2022672 RepID=A0A9Q0C1Q1_9POAL|nr:hypothetical protein LUZ63_017047 [Rhynchospora breviuscula]
MDSDEELEQQTLLAAMLVMDDINRRRQNLNMCMIEWKEVKNDRPMSGSEWILNQLQGHSDRCYENYRMSTDNFNALCKELEQQGLQCNGEVILEEQVGMFLQLLGHAHKMRKIGEDFQHSIETDAVGAIDGTHVPAFPNKKDKFKDRFINRKGDFTQNVMAAVDFDGNFLAVVAGWEGSAHDNMILRCALEEGFLFVPPGKYYLVDAGYANTPQFLAPYRKISYHLGTFRDRARSRGDYRYDKPEELFNHRHAQLRNVVERTFGVLKGRFHILKDMAPFEFDIQVKVVGACCTLHNFINHHNRLQNVSDESFFQAPNGSQGLQVGQNGEESDSQDGDAEFTDLQNGGNLREHIKNSLWQMLQHAQEN